MSNRMLTLVLAAAGLASSYVAGVGRGQQNIRCVMSNSFAFGGTNAVLIATRPRR